MDARTARGVLVSVVLGGAIAAAGVPAVPAAEVGAGTSPAGAHVSIDVDGSYVEQGRPGGTGSGAAGCARRWEPVTGPVADPGFATYLGLLFGPSPSPEHRPFTVYCGADFVDAVWLVPAAFTVAPRAPSAVELAARLARDLPYPQVRIGVNPDGRGLTGLESWFWVDGYDGAPIANAVAAFGATVEVQASPGSATWDFGDGSAPVTGRVGGGPADASATHVYERRSDAAGYTVAAEFAFSVRYRVNGGPWVDLPPVARDASRSYEVVESRAQLVPGGD